MSRAARALGSKGRRRGGDDGGLGAGGRTRGLLCRRGQLWGMRAPRNFHLHRRGLSRNFRLKSLLQSFLLVSPPSFSSSFLFLFCSTLARKPSTHSSSSRSILTRAPFQRSSGIPRVSRAHHGRSPSLTESRNPSKAPPVSSTSKLLLKARLFSAGVCFNGISVSPFPSCLIFALFIPFNSFLFFVVSYSLLFSLFFVFIFFLLLLTLMVVVRAD